VDRSTGKSTCRSRHDRFFSILLDLSPEISLCLYRVLQEALQNAMKHSGGRHFTVSLTGGGKEIELTVQDSGVGFDSEHAIRGEGLGLSSMQERLKLVNGQLFIDSNPQRGTTVQARVPSVSTRKLSLEPHHDRAGKFDLL
jgi:signal transduction histidine kinase